MATKVPQRVNRLLLLVERLDLILIFVFAILVVVSLSKLIYDCPKLAKAFIATSWPSTEGKIIWSEMTRKEMVALHASESKTQGTRISAANYEVYTPDLEYEYVINGEAYRSNRLYTYTTTYRTEAKAQSILSKYPKQRKVMVYYNPDKPAIAVLEPGIHDYATYLVLGVSFCIGVFGLFVCWLSAKKLQVSKTRFG